ncbi:MAG: hypothetical protein IAF08_05750 [Rhizobacter sp.]|nr:hypothetical protein [Chlorobiales bacterium]
MQQIRSKLKPGQKGTKKLLAEYGAKLVCVRYRYDEVQMKRFKTIELIVDEAAWIPRPKRSGKKILEDKLRAATEKVTTDLVQAASPKPAPPQTLKPVSKATPQGEFQPPESPSDLLSLEPFVETPISALPPTEPHEMNLLLDEIAATELPEIFSMPPEEPNRAGISAAQDSLPEMSPQPSPFASIEAKLREAKRKAAEQIEPNIDSSSNTGEDVFGEDAPVVMKPATADVSRPRRPETKESRVAEAAAREIATSVAEMFGSRLQFDEKLRMSFDTFSLADLRKEQEALIVLMISEKPLPPNVNVDDFGFSVEQLDIIANHLTETMLDLHVSDKTILETISRVETLRENSIRMTDNDPIKMTLKLPKSEQWVFVLIKNTATQSIRSLSMGLLKAGVHVMVWDKLDNSGRRFPRGRYTIDMFVDGRLVKTIEGELN